MSSFHKDISRNEKPLFPMGKTLEDEESLKKEFPEIIFQDEKMKDILRAIQKISPSSSPVLILGETGTGKELIARAIHQHSGRASKRLIPINCSAIPENILEAELFGYEKGAFTGADRTKEGILDSLEGGTLFLDEIGDMPSRLQVKLLRVLQEKKFMPLGSRKEKEVDVRFIAATNKNLEVEVKENRFRSDLFYRLNVLPIHIPALRERKQDIPLLLDYFVESFEKKNHVKLSLDEEAIHLFCHYSWPGNIRELCNFVERVCLLKGDGQINKKDLPDEILKPFSLKKNKKKDFLEPQEAPEGILSLPEKGFDLDAYLEEVENFFIKEALLQTGNNKKEAAKLLSVNRTTLVERIKKKTELGGW